MSGRNIEIFSTRSLGGRWLTPRVALSPSPPVMSAVVAVGLHALHEKVRHPHRVEEVARARLLFAVVLLQVQELEDVRVPWLEVDCEGALALAAALVDVTRGVVVHAQHRDQPVGLAVRA